MSKTYFLAFLTIGAFSLFVLLANTKKSDAASGQPFVSLEFPDQIVVGEPATVLIRLTRAGNPVWGEVIEVTIGNGYPRRIRSESNGVARFSVPRDLPAGLYVLSARYAGSRSKQFAPIVSKSFTVDPATLAVKFEPAAEGIRVSLRLSHAVSRGSFLSSRPIPFVFSSDREGIARAPIVEPGTYQIQVLDTDIMNGDDRIQFVNWSDGPSEVSRQIEVPGRLSFDVRVSVTVPTTLTIATSSSRVTESYVVIARLETMTGRPVPDGPIEFWLDGTSIRRARTDENGVASEQFPGDIAAGTHTMNAVFTGIPSKRLVRQELRHDFGVLPASIQIKTVPPVSGVEFGLTSQQKDSLASVVHAASSDASGVASFSVSNPGTYVLTAGNLTSRSDIRASFQRWQDDVFQATRTFNLKPEVLFEAGFEVSYLVTHFIVDTDGNPVDPARVQDIKITNSQGEHFQLDREPQWLVGRRAVRGKQGLEPVEVQYSLDSVIIDGSNVVTRNQQRFYPSAIKHWPIEVKLFTLRISARDALFGLRMGSGFNLIYPDGRTQQFTFSKGSEITISGLARGNYIVQIDEGIFARTIPISMTKDQIAQMEVITIWDVIGGVFFSLFVSIGLILVGRFRIMHDSRWRILLRWLAAERIR